MRVNWNYIKGLLLLGLVCFLYAFSTHRNSALNATGIEVNFLGDNNLFVTHKTVNKLLIQNQQTVTNVPKEIIPFLSKFLVS